MGEGWLQRQVCRYRGRASAGAEINGGTVGWGERAATDGSGRTYSQGLTTCRSGRVVQIVHPTVFFLDPLAPFHRDHLLGAQLQQRLGLCRDDVPVRPRLPARPGFAAEGSQPDGLP